MSHSIPFLTRSHAFALCLILLFALATTASAREYNDGVTTLLNSRTGCLEVFAVGSSPSDRSIFRNTQCGAPRRSWGAWKNLGGQTHYQAVHVAATQAKDGRLFVVVQGTDNQVWARWQRSAGSSDWDPWWRIGIRKGGWCGTCLVSVSTNAAGWPEVFIGDNGIYHAWFLPNNGSNGAWSSWKKLNSLDPGETDIVAVHGPNNLMWISTTKQNDRGSTLGFVPQITPSRWGKWQTLGSKVGDPAAALNQDRRMEVVASRVSDGQIFHRYQTKSGWSKWIDLRGRVSDLEPHIAMGQNSCGQVTIAVVGTDRAIWANRETSAGSSRFAPFWQALGGEVPSHSYISLGSYWNGQAAVFVPGTDGKVWFKFQPSCDTWTSDWYPLPDFYP